MNFLNHNHQPDLGGVLLGLLLIGYLCYAFYKANYSSTED